MLYSSANVDCGFATIKPSDRNRREGRTTADSQDGIHTAHQEPLLPSPLSPLRGKVEMTKGQTVVTWQIQ